VDDELRLGGIASLESSTTLNIVNLQKRQLTVVRGTVSRIYKVKENNVSISPSMCFFASAVIDGPTVNGILLIVESFTVFFHHFFLIFFLQGESNCKCDNTDNSENVTKIWQ
jgi:hypothetical protein